MEQVLGRWTEYCSDLYNYRIQGNEEVLDVSTTEEDTTDNDDSILKEEVTEAIKFLKVGKSPGVDNIPPEHS